MIYSCFIQISMYYGLEHLWLLASVKLHTQYLPLYIKHVYCTGLRLNFKLSKLQATQYTCSREVLTLYLFKVVLRISVHRFFERKETQLYSIEPGTTRLNNNILFKIRKLFFLHFKHTFAMLETFALFLLLSLYQIIQYTFWFIWY